MSHFAFEATPDGAPEGRSTSLPPANLPATGYSGGPTPGHYSAPSPYCPYGASSPYGSYGPPPGGEVSYRSWLITLILAIFFGFAGVDRFYTGKIATGLLKFFTTGGLGLWWLVDIILLATHAYRDKEGRALAGYRQHRKIGLSIAALVLGAVVAFFVWLSATVPEESAPSGPIPAPNVAPSPGNPGETPREPGIEAGPNTGGMGDTLVADNGLSVALDGVEEGWEPTGTAATTFMEPSTGTYVLLSITLGNESAEAESASSADFELVAPDGTRYSPAPLFGVDGGLLLEEVVPGQTLRRKLLYDVPAGMDIRELELVARPGLVDSSELTIRLDDGGTVV